MKKNKRCRVYYHSITKKVFHRICVWPNRSITASRVRINTEGDERLIELYGAHADELKAEISRLKSQLQATQKAHHRATAAWMAAEAKLPPNQRTSPFPKMQAVKDSAK